MIRKQLLLFLFIILKFVLQYSLVNPLYELHRDEFLHLDQGSHLSPGYLSVPPFTSWVAWVIHQLGGSDFWIRFFPALFGALTIVVVWKAIEALRGGIYALVLGATAVLFSALLRLNILFQPNSFDVLAWTFLYYCVLKYCISEKSKWLWWAAVCFAIGFLNKYNIAFQMIGLLPALLLNKQRTVFLKPAFYISFLVALLIILPNLYWQYKNGFPVFYHLRELTSTQLVNMSRADFLREQLLYYIGSIFVLIAGFISFFLYEPFKKFQVIFYGFMITMFVFIFLRAKGYYAMGIYPIFLAFGATWLEKLLSKGWKKYVIRPLLIIMPITLLLLMVEMAFPILAPQEIVNNAEGPKELGLHKWEDGKEHPISQDFADMLGWKELASLVDSAYQQIPDKENTLVFCDNYGQAGSINHYSKYKEMNALSMNADYVFWFPPNKTWKNMIMVKEVMDSDSARTEERLLFDSIYTIGKIKNPFARELGTRVYVLLNAKDSTSKILYTEVERRKNEHRQ